jgi:hypothetical protein
VRAASATVPAAATLPAATKRRRNGDLPGIGIDVLRGCGDLVKV